MNELIFLNLKDAKIRHLKGVRYKLFGLGQSNVKRFGFGLGLDKLICNMDFNGFFQNPKNLVIIKKLLYFFDCILEKDLRRFLHNNATIFTRIRCYKGIRKIFFLPSRGQRTRCNRGTGKILAGLKITKHFKKKGKKFSDDSSDGFDSKISRKDENLITDMSTESDNSQDFFLKKKTGLIFVNFFDFFLGEAK